MRKAVDSGSTDHPNSSWTAAVAQSLHDQHLDRGRATLDINESARLDTSQITDRRGRGKEPYPRPGAAPRPKG